MTTKNVEAGVEFALENRARFVDELKALLRIPSVSTLPEHAKDVRAAAEFVAAELKRIGMENVRLIETATEKHLGGHPLVYADWLHADGKPTVLCYGHYDVQPRNLWMSGGRLRSSLRSGMGIFMRVGRWMTRGRCGCM